MIEARNITKSYRTTQGRHYLFRDLSFTIPTGANAALIGRNGVGKSTLLRILGGLDYPDEGEVIRDVSISWPLGLKGGFQGNLSARENVKFICRIYGRTEGIDDTIENIKTFSELGKYFEEPVRTYSNGMRARLAFALSLAFRFDVYLIDELLSVGDEIFKAKAKAALRELHGRASILLVSHNIKTVKELCDIGIILTPEKARVYTSIREAISVYKRKGKRGRL